MLQYNCFVINNHQSGTKQPKVTDFKDIQFLPFLYFELPYEVFVKN